MVTNQKIYISVIIFLIKMEIIQKSDEKYLKQGINAIKDYRVNELGKDIDEVIMSQKDKLKFKSTAKKFKKNALKFTNISLGGQKEILKFMNKNEYIKKTAKDIESYISKNYLLLGMGLRTIEVKLDININDFGFEINSYKPILEAFQKKGLVGKGSGLDFIVDKLMKNTENVTTAASKALTKSKWDINKINKFISPTGITIKGIENSYNKKGFKGKKGVFNYITDKIIDNLENVSALILDEIGEEEIKGMSIKQIGKDVFSDLGITIQSIQKAYKEGGLNGETGVIKHLSDNIIINGIKKVYNEMLSPEFGKDEKFASKDMIKAYKKDGIVGRNGLVNKAVGMAFWKVPFLDRLLYSQILNLTENYKRKKELKKIGEEFKFSREINMSRDMGISQRNIETFLGGKEIRNIEAKFLELSKEMPKEMSQAKLERVYKTHGVFGDKGLISYLSENIPLIFEYAQGIGALDEADVKDLSKIVKNFSNLESPENIKFGSRNKYELFAIDVAKKSEEMQIDPKELLSNPAYIGVRKDIIEQVHGSIEKYEKYCENYHQSTMELLKSMHKLGDLDAKEIIKEIKDITPGSFLGGLVDKAAAKYINQKVVDKANDYLNLTKVLVEQQLEKNKEEIQAYKAVKAQVI